MRTLPNVLAASQSTHSPDSAAHGYLAILEEACGFYIRHDVQGGCDALISQGGSGRGALSAVRSPVSVQTLKEDLRCCAQPFAEDAARGLGSEGDACAVVLTMASTLPQVMPLSTSSKDMVDLPGDVAMAARSMIGSERPPTAPAAAAVPVTESSGHVDKPRPMSPVLPPATLNRLRLSYTEKPLESTAAVTIGTPCDGDEVPRRDARDRNAAPTNGDHALLQQHVMSGDGALPRDESMDLWAGASPFLSSSRTCGGNAFGNDAPRNIGLAPSQDPLSAPPTPPPPNSAFDAARQPDSVHCFLV